MTAVPPEAIEEAIRLFIAGESVATMITAATPIILAPVYTWLVEELGFPFDLATHTRPPWLDVTRLAEAWSKHEEDTVENYRLTILEETGWPDETGGPR